MKSYECMPYTRVGCVCKFEGVQLICVKGISCLDCDLYHITCFSYTRGVTCSANTRFDRTDVVFKVLEVL